MRYIGVNDFVSALAVLRSLAGSELGVYLVVRRASLIAECSFFHYQLVPGKAHVGFWQRLAFQ